MSKNIIAEVVTTTGVMRYPVLNNPQSPYVALGKNLLDQPLRFNKKEDRIEFLREDGEWDVYISDSELLCFQIIHM